MPLRARAGSTTSGGAGTAWISTGSSELALAVPDSTRMDLRAAGRGRRAAEPGREQAAHRRQRDLREQEEPDGDRGEKDQPGPHVPEPRAQRLGGGPAHDAAVPPLAGSPRRQLREHPGRREEENAETREREPAPRDEGGGERGGSPQAQQRRQHEARIPEGAEDRPAEPGADRAHERALPTRGQGGIEQGEGHEHESGAHEGDDALDLAQPALAVALARQARGLSSVEAEAGIRRPG